MIKNKKGYMLVEIILASVIAFSIAYFIINLTINLKNKNDDMYASTLVSTDQAIITNKIMDGIMSNPEGFKCSDISVDNTGKIVKYKGDIIDVMGSSSTISYDEEANCKIDTNGIEIDMPVTINQLKSDFSVHINYRFLSVFSTIVPAEPHLGDYVYYKPPKTDYKTEITSTGMSNYETLNPSELELWRIIAINGDGSIDIVSDSVSSTNVSFYYTGFYNYITYLNTLAKQYEDPDYTIRSRYFSYQGDFNLVNSILKTRAATDVNGVKKTYWIPYLDSRRWEQSNGRGYVQYRVYYIDTDGNLNYTEYHGADVGFADYWYVRSAAIRPIVTLKSGLTFVGKGTKSEPLIIQKAQLNARVDGSNLSAKVTASDGTILINATSYEFKVSTNSTCNETTVGFTRSSNNTYSTTVDKIDNYYVCAKVGYTSGEYGYISKMVSQVGQYIVYQPRISNYKTEITKTGISKYETLNPSELKMWRILAIHDDDTVDLISEHVSSLNVTFYGLTGFNNYKSYLDTLAKQYEDPNYTVGSRYLSYPDDFDLSYYVLGTRAAIDTDGKKKTYWVPHLSSRRWEQSNGRGYVQYNVHYVDTNGDLASTEYHGADVGFADHWYERSAALRPVVVLKSNLTISGTGTEKNPIAIQNAQLIAKLNGSKLSAEVTASDNTVLTNVRTYDFKISKSSTCNSSVTGFERASNNKYTTNVSNIDNYYVCAKIGYTSGEYGYISKMVSQVGQYIVYQPRVTEYKTKIEYTGLSSYQTLDPSELKMWRILNINKDGTVDIVSDHVSSINVSFYGNTGFSNYTSYLNVLASQYEDDNYTKGSRYFSYPGDFDLSYYVLGNRIAKDNNGNVKSYWLPSLNHRRWEQSNGRGYVQYNVNFVNTNGDLASTEYHGADVGFADNWYERSAALRPVVVLKSNLTISGKGTSENPIAIQNAQLMAELNGANVTATITASDNTLLTNVKTYEFKVSKNSTCDSSVTGFTSSSNNKYTTTVPNIGNYYVCAKVGYTSGNYAYISKKISHLGQFVRYTPSLNSFNTDSSKTGVASQTINPSELNLWRVLNIYENGTVDLISEHVSSTSVKFYGNTGFSNYTSYLNVLASQYENSKYTIGSRHFNYPDDYNISYYVLGTRKVTNNEGTAQAYWLPYLTSKRWEQSNGRGYVQYNVNYVNTNGDIAAIEYHGADVGFADHWYERYATIRPIVVLKSNISISGTGSSNSPITFQ